MRDLVLFAHIILGMALIALPILIIFEINKKESKLLKPVSFLNAFIAGFLLIPAGKLYLTFYPATKTLIKSGPMPWAHSIIMETKEHWGLLLPLIATMSAWLVFSGKNEESKKWWILTIVISFALGIMGWIVRRGALAA